MNETGRVEAFSDGVFAIAITLLILDVKVPGKPAPGHLGGALLDEWPMFLAFLTSFFTIGVMWMNHHRLFNLIGAVDDALVALNLLLLLGITWIPFPTALLSTHLRETGNDRTAAIIYSATFFVMSIFFRILWNYATRTSGIIPPENEEQAAHITRQYRWGPLFYIVSMAIAIFSGTACLIWSLLLAIYFAIPPAIASRTMRR